MTITERIERHIANLEHNLSTFGGLSPEKREDLDAYRLALAALRLQAWAVHWSKADDGDGRAPFPEILARLEAFGAPPPDPGIQ